MWIDILLPHMFVHHVQTGPKEARKGNQILWDWSSKRL